MKRIIICADGTWNRPEEFGKKKQYPTNVLRLARGIAATGENDTKQVVFYDWGIGSYHDSATGGAFGKGLEKNVMDGYRFLVHNYEPGDEIYLFGFSRGAYTVRSLCGMINNCSILKSSNGSLVEHAFAMYKNPKYRPNDTYSMAWKNKYSVEDRTKVKFVGVWDTVGAMGLPFTIFGLIKDKHLFYDNKLGSNIEFARHALSLDEKRKDFEPTIWVPRPEVDLEQVWFAGVHSDVGGSYPPDKDGTILSDIPLNWLIDEASAQGLKFDLGVRVANTNPLSKTNRSFKGAMKLLGKRIRKIPQMDDVPTKVHVSVRERYNSIRYRPAPLQRYLKKNGGNWPEVVG